MKSKILLSFFLLLPLNFVSISYAGEPIKDIEVSIKIDQSSDNMLIAIAVTNKKGEFDFSFPNGLDVPKHGGIFIMTITPPKKLLKSKDEIYTGMQVQTVEIPFKKKDGSIFKYILTWEPKTKSNQGGFAVSGRNNSFTLTGRNPETGKAIKSKKSPDIVNDLSAFGFKNGL